MKHKWKYYHRIWSFSFTEMYLKERPLLDEAIPKLQNCGFRRDNRVWWQNFYWTSVVPNFSLHKKCTLRIWLTHLPKIGWTFTVIQGVDLVLVFQYYRGMVLFWNWHPTKMEIPDTWANGADIWYIHTTIMSTNSYMNIARLLSNVIFQCLIFKQAFTLMLEYSAKSQIKNATH